MSCFFARYLVTKQNEVSFGKNIEYYLKLKVIK